MDVMKEDVKLVGVSEEDGEGAGEMGADDWLWPPLKETARRRGGRGGGGETQQPIHSCYSAAKTETHESGSNCVADAEFMNRRLILAPIYRADYLMPTCFFLFLRRSRATMLTLLLFSER